MKQLNQQLVERLRKREIGVGFVKGTDSLEDLRLLLATAFPEDNSAPTGLSRFYYRFDYQNWSCSTDDVPRNTVIPLSDFFIAAPTPEQWQPKWGEEVEVSDDGKSWNKGVFVSINPVKESSFKWVFTDRIHNSFSAWKHCRKPIQIFTLQQIADLINLPVDGFKIEG